MIAPEPFAQQLAESFLGRHCGCYGDAFPAPSCARAVEEVATAIAGGYASHVAPVDLARSLLKSHCACHQLLGDQPGAETACALERDIDVAARTIEAAFHARHLEEAHEDAVASDIRGG